jgi:ribosome maturation factor RimP
LLSAGSFLYTERLAIRSSKYLVGESPLFCLIRAPVDLDKIREAAERVARPEGIDVLDVEWKQGRQRLLRVYIDKPDGITHGDCQKVSEQLGVVLDVEDLVPGPGYVLEVSSPGLDRKLRGPAEFERFAGRRARISLSEPVENATFFEGRLAGLAEGMVRLEVNGRVVLLPLDRIRKASLVVEW